MLKLPLCLSDIKINIARLALDLNKIGVNNALENCNNIIRCCVYVWASFLPSEQRRRIRSPCCLILAEEWNLKKIEKNLAVRIGF